LLGACSGNGVGLDANGEPQRSGATDDFSVIQSTIFTPICTACHSGAGAPYGLRLDASSSYDLLVGVPSGEAPNIARVQPGDPDNSYLIQKLNGNAAFGDRMPLGGPYLSPANVDLIRQWIANGAMRPALAVEKSRGLSVVASGVVTTRRLFVVFDRDLDASLLHDSTVQLLRADATAVPVTMSMPAHNPRVLLIDSRTTPLDGSYTLVLRGSGGGALAGIDARVLNGDADNQGSNSTLVFDMENAQ
jgi:hypothetical protein